MDPDRSPVSPDGAKTSAEGVRSLVDDLFRRSAGRMVARLTRIFGPENLALVEDVVQESLLKALGHWPHHGVPDRPEAWLARVARNLALDSLRRDATPDARERERLLDEWQAPGAPDDGADDQELRDDQLRMIFTCCHPALPPESRVALTLKALGGFGVCEIARAFLVSESTVAQRLVRAKRRLREEHVPFAVPAAGELEERLGSVLDVLYLTFNEGFSRSRGPDLVSRELVDEALRLTTLLLELPSTSRPEVHALQALMLFQGARLPARLDASGNPLLLAEQDRSLWDARLIARGFAALQRARTGDHLSKYHLEAGIASCHAVAGSWESTDWQAILGFYDLLVERQPSPVVALNRAVALSMVAGPQAALRELEALAGRPELAAYHLLPCVLGELHLRAGNEVQAARYFRRALELGGSDPERQLVRAKLARCGA